MKREELLSSPEYWITKIQVALYNCAASFMKKNNKNKKQLAEQMGVSKSYVTQLFNGNYDHRLSKLIELSLHFGYVPEIKFKPIEQVLREDRRDYFKINQMFVNQCSPYVRKSKSVDATKSIIKEAGTPKNDNNAA